MRRVAVFLVLVSAAAAGVWALPAPGATPSLEAAAAGAVDPSAPDLPMAPRLAEAAREVDSAESDRTAADPTDATTSDEPDERARADHLAAETRAPEVEPIVIVTTTVAPPTTTAAPTPSPPTVTVAFSAQQAYGSCEEPIPYDIFSGTATPGSTITISSAYGSGSATAGSDGHWERKVEFPTAPRGEQFAVNVSGLGGSKTLHFTATAAAGH